MSILNWPSEIREHRSWSEEPTELSDWYVCDRRLTLNWTTPKSWGFGIRRHGPHGFSVEFGPAFFYLEPKEAP